MADVFISYAREDRAAAEQIARAVGALGFEVFWDSEVPPGQTWADYIESKLAQCKVMIVLWSATSTQSQWVREEARMARDRGVLIPAMLDNSPPPFGFGEVQAANLTGWRGDANHPEWRRLVTAITSAAGAPKRPAQPTPQFRPQAAYDDAPAAGGAKLSPLDYVKKCFRLYANGNGRARRAEYWWFVLFEIIVVVIAAILDVGLFGVNYEDVPNAPVFTLICILGLVCPAISVTARRFHDVGLNGWLVLVGYVLSLIWIGSIFIFVVSLLPGQPRDNQYGPNPKAG
jgi:uncharacterized membrane protein YhaH (DUF805 family)